MRRLMLLAAALLLSGCGIPATGVIESGDPATGVRSTALLYFVTDDRLVPVGREVTDPADVRAAVETLLTGPDMRDRLRGLTTALSRVPAPAISTDGAEVSVQLSAGTESLPPIAVRQLICTAAAARMTDDPDTVATGVTVVVTGPGGRRTQGTSRGCPTLAAARPVASPTGTPEQ
ncbi:hypothetical protein ACFV2H_30455 [Streptomyces sp. NPDC059629]|uniref:hypothetical protein n=1 Tax=Streptomyces sp. NPDC059629 TaxID=3346889 RepID=UPI0036CC3E0F